jgi:hypothetical protein
LAVDCKHGRPMSTKLYMTPLGYTDKRPANFPALDRRAVMVEAHRIAKRFRPYHASYREALAYGLAAAWKANWSARITRSLANQVSQVAPAPSMQASTVRWSPMLGSYGYVGA